MMRRDVYTFTCRQMNRHHTMGAAGFDKKSYCSNSLTASERLKTNTAQVSGCCGLVSDKCINNKII